MFSFKNLYGNLGFQTSYEDSIPEDTEQTALETEESKANVAPAKVKQTYLALVGMLLAVYFLSR